MFALNCRATQKERYPNRSFQKIRYTSFIKEESQFLVARLLKPWQPLSQAWEQKTKSWQQEVKDDRRDVLSRQASLSSRLWTRYRGSSHSFLVIIRKTLKIFPFLQHVGKEPSETDKKNQFAFAQLCKEKSERIQTSCNASFSPIAVISRCMVLQIKKIGGFGVLNAQKLSVGQDRALRRQRFGTLSSNLRKSGLIIQTTVSFLETTTKGCHCIVLIPTLQNYVFDMTMRF